MGLSRAAESDMSAPVYTAGNGLDYDEDEYGPDSETSPQVRFQPLLHTLQHAATIGISRHHRNEILILMRNAYTSSIISVVERLFAPRSSVSPKLKHLEQDTADSGIDTVQAACGRGHAQLVVDALASLAYAGAFCLIGIFPATAAVSQGAAQPIYSRLSRDRSSLM